RSAMSIPRTLSLRKDGGHFALVQKPVKTLDSWRGEPLRVSNKSIEDAAAEVAEVHGARFDIQLRLAPGDADEAGIKLRVGNGEETLVGWSRLKGGVFVDRTHSGNGGFHPDFRGVYVAPLDLRDGVVDLRIVCDDCSVEVFADGGAAVITDLIFPSGSSQGLTFFAKGGEAKVVAANIFPLGRR
ncbi:MAG: GH32 C-terminal domain-containing protein, partial [Verrucomicrobiae bacterium]|nr:GH32 C-terminal domain-containing protein [Verrucomicrobiae bacterium]